MDCKGINEGLDELWTERTSWVFLLNTWVRSLAEPIERDLLVAYPVIDIRDSLKEWVGQAEITNNGYVLKHDIKRWINRNKND